MRPDEPAAPGDQDLIRAASGAVIDVILPGAGRAAGPARGAGVAPARVPGHRGGQRFHRRLGPAGGQPRRAVVTNPCGGSGRPASPGWSRPTRTWCASWIATGRSTGPPAQVAAPVVEGRADLVMGRRRAARGSWPVHARLANVVSAWPCGPATACGWATSGHAGGPPSGAAGAGDRGPPLRLAARDGGAGRRRGGGASSEVDVPYQPRQGRSKVTGTVRGTLRTVRDMAAVLADEVHGGRSSPPAGARDGHLFSLGTTRPTSQRRARPSPEQHAREQQPPPQVGGLGQPGGGVVGRLREPEHQRERDRQDWPRARPAPGHS